MTDVCGAEVDQARETTGLQIHENMDETRIRVQYNSFLRVRKCCQYLIRQPRGERSRLQGTWPLEIASTALAKASSKLVSGNRPLSRKNACGACLWGLVDASKHPPQGLEHAPRRRPSKVRFRIATPGSVSCRGIRWCVRGHSRAFGTRPSLGRNPTRSERKRTFLGWREDRLCGASGYSGSDGRQSDKRGSHHQIRLLR